MSTVYSGVDCVCIRRASVKQEQSLLTLGAHAQEGYGTCPVCLSVCLSVTT